MQPPPLRIQPNQPVPMDEEAWPVGDRADDNLLAVPMHHTAQCSLPKSLKPPQFGRFSCLGIEGIAPELRPDADELIEHLARKVARHEYEVLGPDSHLEPPTGPFPVELVSPIPTVGKRLDY